ncbi:MBL fold metallo-hydrolase [Microscilla marina]|uniref:Metallo-beta-lactamase superfamily protein n=1 Tax=Microscilla marina ATCC 23134 TaxID=313606 RepID=A1ZVS4_MICM2|nr:MBL fold metallo-hydrolase [Microscilla marina]EAY25501.1 metallo-beta-lactamase superfamily protein [Microscilla marina ATCC 23134]
MKVEQIYTGCLAEAAYYIESNGEAAIIDPLRETEPYTRKVAQHGATLKYIFETHFHADFVSGHVDLAKKTGATIVFGPEAKTSYDIYSAQDGDVFEIGKVKIKALHTPGHTLESTTYLLIDEEGKHHAIFSGDTLFIGDVGRPDLAVKSDLTKEDLAGMLFNSLRHKIMPLADDVIVYPGHGAGSACGKNMSDETFDSLGNQKKTNYALRADMTKEEFVKEVTDGILPPPQYFAKNVMLNKQGYEEVDEVLGRGMKALSIEEFETKKSEGVVILDTRHEQIFNKGFVPGAINIGLEGTFAVWVGTLIKNLNEPIMLVAPKGKEKETVLRLARVGYDNAIGYLKGGFDAWQTANKPVDQIKSIEATELATLNKSGNINILDVRKPTEYQSERIVDAQNFPLDFINGHLNDLDKEATYYIHCAGGYRSMITSSILKKHGYPNVIEVKGGFREIAKTDIAKTEYVCPSTLS